MWAWEAGDAERRWRNHPKEVSPITAKEFFFKHLNLWECEFSEPPKIQLLTQILFLIVLSLGDFLKILTCPFSKASNLCFNLLISLLNGISILSPSFPSVQNREQGFGL